MRNRIGLVVFLAILALGVGGCAGTGGKTVGAAAGGIAMHALTGGASTAWHVIGTAAGAGAGYVAGEELVDKKKK